MLFADDGRYRLIYQTAVEESRLVVWEYDIHEKTITFAQNSYSKFYCRQFDLPGVITTVPHSMLVFFDEKSIKGYVDMFDAIDKGAGFAECTVHYKMRNDSFERYEHISITTVYDESGRAVSAIGISKDITEAVREKQNFANLNKLYESVVENALSSSHLDLSRDVCFEVRSRYSHVTEQLDCDKASVFFQKSSHVCVCQDFRDRFLSVMNIEKLTARFNAGERSADVLYPVIGLDNEYRWIKCYVFMSQNPETSSIEAITWTQDVTNEHNRELVISRLTDVAIHYLGIISVRTGNMTLLSADGNSCSQYIGKSVSYKDVMRTLCNDVVSEDDWAYYLNNTDLEHIKKELDASKDYKFPFAAAINGEKHRLQSHYFYFNREFGQILIVTSDITTSYELERKRIRLMEDALFEAEQANISRLDFITRISHDIRTPMGIISNMSDFALADIDNKERLTEDLRKIKSANTFLMSLINDVVDISNFNNERIRFTVEPYSTEDYIDDVRSVFATLCEQHNIEFSINKVGDDVILLTDRVRFRQIALNLLNNAVNFTPEHGHILYSLSIMPEGLDKVRVIVVVKDSGIGMKGKFSKVMFQPFSQEVDNPFRSKSASGAGLGLYIVKSIVDLMGGTITVKSVLGKGTEVTCNIVFPVAKKEDIEAASKCTTEESEDVKLSGKVLLVDDNDINREIGVRILNSIGVDADEVENGDLAVKKMLNTPAGTYIAILMDIQMPILNGYEAASAIRAMEKSGDEQIPIIALTANAFQDAVEKAKACGMNDLITKPLEKAQLREVLARFVKNGAHGWQHVIHKGIYEV